MYLQSILSIVQPGQNAVKNQMNAPIVSEKPGVGVQIRCKRVNDKVKFQCEASDLYRALTEPEVGLVSSLETRLEMYPAKLSIIKPI